MTGVVRWWRRAVRGTARRRVVSDAALTFVAGVGLLSLGLVGLWAGAPRPVESPWVHLVPLAVGCVVMLGKRRWPALALVGGGLVAVGDVALGGSLAVLIVLIDLIYSAVLFSGPVALRRLSTGIAVAIGGFTVGGFVSLGTVPGALLFGLQAFALLGTPLWWGLSVRRHAQLRALAEERAADLERLAELRQREVLAEERTRMARDLHDAIAGNLSAIAIHAEAALAVPGPTSGPTRPDGSPDRAARPGTSGGGDARTASLEAIRAASVQSLHEMRSMIMLLRDGTHRPDSPHRPDSTGQDDTTTDAQHDHGPAGEVSPPRLREAPALLDAVAAQGREVTWSGCALEDLPEIPAAVDQAAYRILQEALTNAAKHAYGPRVDVDLALGPRGLRVRVVNGTQGGEPGTGWGLLTMRERAEALGGTLQAGRHEDARWVVEACLPLTAGARP